MPKRKWRIWSTDIQNIALQIHILISSLNVQPAHLFQHTEEEALLRRGLEFDCLVRLQLEVTGHATQLLLHGLLQLRDLLTQLCTGRSAGTVRVGQTVMTTERPTIG